MPTHAASNALHATPWVRESWTVERGLPINAVNAVLQDPQGYIWLATFDGVVRFDGARFTVYNTANTPAISSNRIVGLTEGTDGALWIWTEQQTVTRRRGAQFTRVAFVARGRDETIGAVFADRDGAIWFATSHGLRAARGDSLVRVAPGILDHPVRSVVRRRDATLWVGTTAHGLYSIDGDRATRVLTGTSLDSASILSLFEDAAGTLWVGTTDGVWTDRGGRFARMSFGGQPTTDVIAFRPSRAANAMFAFTESGVYRLDITRQPVAVTAASIAGRVPWGDSTSVWYAIGPDVYRDGARVYTLPEEQRNSELHTIITAGIIDREGSVWLGTQGAGLHRLKPSLFSVFSESEGMPARNIYTTYADRTGDVWTPSATGLARIDAGTGRVTRSSGPPGFPTGVRSIVEDTAGHLWIGGQGVSVCVSIALTTCRPVSAPVRDFAVFALHLDARGTLWVGSTAGLMRLEDGGLRQLPESSGAPAALVRVFAETRDGALWMGSNGGGLARYGDGRFTAVTAADSLPSDLVRSLYVDADGWLWVGTEGRGLVRLDPRAWGNSTHSEPRPIVSIDSRSGLFDDVIHQILEDDFGRLWMSTNRGIFWVSRAELNAFAEGRIQRVHSTSYTERDGLRNREANGGSQPAGAKTRDGRLWFPTQDGVAMVDPAHVTRDRVPPTVVVEQVTSRSVSLAHTGDRVDVAVGQRDFEVEYTALTFLEPANVRFRYRLEPYDAEWVDAGNRRTAFYTQVRPGIYTFRLQASDGEGGWHQPGALLTMRVLPRVWETSAFRLSLAAMLALGVFAAFRWRLRLLQAQARALERVVDERTSTIRAREQELADQNVRLAALAVELRSLDHAKTRFFANVSHEFRTPLTLTIGPLEDLRARAGGDPQVDRWLDIALRNARRLLRLVNQILDVAKLEAGQMRLVRRPIDLGAFVRGIAGAFEAVAERRAITLEVNVPATGALIGSFDPDAVEKILTNLLSNALKFTPEGGRVTVALTLEGEAACLRVADTGPGFDTEQMAHVFERFWQVDESATRTQPGTGIGLSLTKELVELHGGTIAVESEGPGKGATFTVTLPFVAGWTGHRSPR